MLSKKIELSVSDMTQVLELAKEQKLELAFDKISCAEGCIARILYENTRRDHLALLQVIQGIHALEIEQIKKVTPPPVNLLSNLKSKKNEDKRF